MIKRELLLEKDMLIFDPWDALRKTDIGAHTGDAVVSFRKTAGFGITLRVFGTIGTSDLTGEKTVEDMQVYLGEEDIYNGLPDNFLQELVNECVEEN